ncbi:MAG: hypothetical protein JNL51_08380 [Chitinophagaceae bacterium]|nr:hypothetical protein [Chitinophagaceae bacterium]
MKKLILSIQLLFLGLFIYAQDAAVSQTEKVATGLRADSKIYVVVAVLVVILAGLFIYIARLDRKISRMEKS